MNRRHPFIVFSPARFLTVAGILASLVACGLLVTVGGPIAAGLITGSFFVESIFRIPGIGSYFVTSIQQRDYPMIMATTLAWTAIISVTFLITDLLYALADPRVTYMRK